MKKKLNLMDGASPPEVRAENQPCDGPYGSSIHPAMPHYGSLYYLGSFTCKGNT